MEIGRSANLTEATMFGTRNSLLAVAAVAMFAVVGSTAAEARYFGSSFCHRGGASFFKSYLASAMQRKAPSARHRDDDDEAQEKYRAASKPAKPAAAIASAPKPVPAAAPVKSATVAAPVKPVSLATAAATTASTVGTTSCLTKEYLDTGAVKFRDVCTNEWAINSTDVANKASSVASNCLTKDSSQNGIVMFKDTCTKEWAMNTVDQQTAQVR
jgi:hypothetical protein